MRIESVTISNFRSFGCDPTALALDDYTCLVGANGCGKSNILQALNVFFRHGPIGELASLVEDDFHARKTDTPISIQVTLTGLNTDAQNDLKHYYRQGKVLITAEARFDPATGRAEVKQFGSRMVMPEFRGFFSASESGAKVGDLRQHYNMYKRVRPGLPAAQSKDEMTSALRAYEEANPGLCSPEPSSAEFYGFTKGANLLAKYLQWVYVPAVKDASSEQVEAKSSAFGKLLARAVRSKVDFGAKLDEMRSGLRSQYRELLDGNRDALSGLTASLGNRLRSWAHPGAVVDVRWRDDEKAIQIGEPLACALAGESGFLGEIGRLGHGVQRCYLLALLQELAAYNDAAGPTLILGCEEPELYQHPPQARYMASVFRDLGEHGAQVIVSTHSPYFVQGDRLGSVRMLRRCGPSDCTRIFSADPAQVGGMISSAREAAAIKPQGLLAKINQELRPEVAEMFFTKLLVLVEGIEDRAYLKAYLFLSGQWDRYRARGCHIVTTDGKSHMIYDLAVAKALRIPTLAMFDADKDKSDKSGSREKHRRDNIALMKLSGISGNLEPFPERPILDGGAIVWPNEMKTTVVAEIGEAQWNSYDQRARDNYGDPGGLEKNMLHIPGVCQ